MKRFLGVVGIVLSLCVAAVIGHELAWRAGYKAHARKMQNEFMALRQTVPYPDFGSCYTVEPVFEGSEWKHVLPEEFDLTLKSIREVESKSQEECDAHVRGYLEWKAEGPVIIDICMTGDATDPLDCFLSYLTRP